MFFLYLVEQYSPLNSISTSKPTQCRTQTHDLLHLFSLETPPLGGISIRKGVNVIIIE